MKKFAIVTDFDGTVTLKDVGDSVLNYFGAASLKEVENSYDPKVDIKEWMMKTFAKLKARPAAIKEYVVKTAKIRKGFLELLDFCEKKSIPLEIVSGGLDIYAKPLTLHWGIKAKSFFGKASFANGSYKLRYSYLKRATLAEFKKMRVEYYQNRGAEVIFCGDGTSDFEAAKATDKIYAAKKLLYLCKKKKMNHFRLTTFSAIQKALAAH